MSAFAMISGRLQKAPEARLTKAGATFATAVVRVAERERATWWSIIGFDDVATDLLRLESGDNVSVSGPFQAEISAGKDGEARIRFSLTADRLASPRIGRRPTEKGAT
jgi:single-stranded DNA-binding protein